MNLAVENLLSVSFFAIGFFLVALFLVQILKIFHKAPEFRIMKRKPLVIPAIVLLLVLPFAPRQHIGPPLGMETHAISNDLGYRFETLFEVYDWSPYLPRVRVDYSCRLTLEEIIECILLISEDDVLIRNSTDVIYYSGSPYSSSTAHTTFDLKSGFYNFTFTQRVLRADGTPTIYVRDVHVSLIQLQDYE